MLHTSINRNFLVLGSFLSGPYLWRASHYADATIARLLRAVVLSGDLQLLLVVLRGFQGRLTFVVFLLQFEKIVILIIVHGLRRFLLNSNAELIARNLLRGTGSLQNTFFRSAMVLRSLGLLDKTHLKHGLDELAGFLLLRDVIGPVVVGLHLLQNYVLRKSRQSALFIVPARTPLTPLMRRFILACCGVSVLMGC